MPAHQWIFRCKAWTGSQKQTPAVQLEYDYLSCCPWPLAHVFICVCAYSVNYQGHLHLGVSKLYYKFSKGLLDTLLKRLEKKIQCTDHSLSWRARLPWVWILPFNVLIVTLGTESLCHRFLLIRCRSSKYKGKDTYEHYLCYHNYYSDRNNQ